MLFLLISYEDYSLLNTEVAYDGARKMSRESPIIWSVKCLCFQKKSSLTDGLILFLFSLNIFAESFDLWAKGKLKQSFKKKIVCFNYKQRSEHQKKRDKFLMPLMDFASPSWHRLQRQMSSIHMKLITQHQKKIFLHLSWLRQQKKGSKSVSSPFWFSLPSNHSNNVLGIFF